MAVKTASGLSGILSVSQTLLGEARDPMMMLFVSTPPSISVEADITRLQRWEWRDDGRGQGRTRWVLSVVVCVGVIALCSMCRLR